MRVSILLAKLGRNQTRPRDLGNAETPGLGMLLLPTLAASLPIYHRWYLPRLPSRFNPVPKLLRNGSSESIFAVFFLFLFLFHLFLFFFFFKNYF